MKKLSSFVLAALLFVCTLLSLTPSASADQPTNPTSTVIISTTPKVAAGSTRPGATNWQDNTVNKDGAFVDVDTSVAQFKTTPIYLVSLAGNNITGQFGLTGTSSIYSPTEKGFRIYIRLESGYPHGPAPTEFNAQYAKDNQWYINWIGIEPGIGLLSQTSTQTPLPTPGKYYYLTAKVSGKVLDLAGGNNNKNTKSANIQQYSKADVDQQKWQLQDAGDGYYYLVCKLSNMVAAVDINSVTNPNNVIQYDKIPTAQDQKWKLEDAGDGYFRLVNKVSGKLLDVQDGSTKDGGNVQQHERNGTDAQKWKFEAV